MKKVFQLNQPVLRGMRIAIVIFGVFVLGACTTNFSSESIDYKSQGEKKTPNLSIPPDLTLPSAQKRYSVADGAATLSQYGAANSKIKETPTKNLVTPEQAGIQIMRDGNRRWLVVQRSGDELYPKVRSFWEDTGFILITDSPNTGIMETDWAENRAKIPQDMIRNFLGKALDSLYSTGERDKFRTRFEKSGKGQTEIYVTHRGSVEELVGVGVDKNSTLWTSRANDPELEAEMLARMMVYLGTNYESAKTSLAGKPTNNKSKATRVNTEGGVVVLTLNQGFDRSWRDVGLALDRSNFTVEDRDRSQGIFFVRFVNPKDFDLAKKDGWFSGWFKSSSKDSDMKKAKRYRVSVKTSDTSTTKVMILEDSGVVSKADISQQILSGIDQQIN